MKFSEKERNGQISRRYFLEQCGVGMGALALNQLLTQSGYAQSNPLAPKKPHFASKAKNVIYLHMMGGPAQMDLFDYKPLMDAQYDKDLPPSIRNGKRITTMTSNGLLPLTKGTFMLLSPCCGTPAGTRSPPGNSSLMT